MIFITINHTPTGVFQPESGAAIGAGNRLGGQTEGADRKKAGQGGGAADPDVSAGGPAQQGKCNRIATLPFLVDNCAGDAPVMLKLALPTRNRLICGR